MPALKPTDFYATLTFIGRNADREVTLRTEPLTSVDLRFGGIEGESRGGITRPSCSRVVSQHPKGTTIANVRQFSVVSAEELAQIAGIMGVEVLDPGWIGASLVVEGLPDFSNIPPSSRLQNEAGTTIVIDMHNRPCHLPAKVIDEDAPGKGRAFKDAAQGRRGVMAWVEREGPLAVGDRLRLHVPDQPVWSLLDAARGR